MFLPLTSAITRDIATLQLAFWASWADCLSMIHKRHPTVAENLRELEGDRDVPLSQQLLMQPGFYWHSGAECWGVCWLIMRRPSCVHRVARELGSRSLPFHRATTLASTLSSSAFCFIVAFTCHCLLLLVSADVAVLSTRLAIIGQLARGRESLAGGVLQWRVRAAQICREAGGRVTTNVMVRDLDLAAPNVRDVRRLELVVDGRAPNSDGIALALARRRKERTHPELVGPRHAPTWWSCRRSCWKVVARDADVPAFIGQSPRERRNCADEAPC